MRKIGFDMTDEEFLNKHSWPIERSMGPACDTMRDFDMTEREIARALRLIADDLERAANPTPPINSTAEEDHRV